MNGMLKWSAFGMLAAACGCATKLETGYEPIRLGSMTPAERRGLYAQSFTTEARAAEADEQSGHKGNANDVRGGHRPGGPE